MIMIPIVFRHKGKWFAYGEIPFGKLSRGFNRNWQVFIVPDLLQGMIQVNLFFKDVPFPNGAYCPWHRNLSVMRKGA